MAQFFLMARSIILHRQGKWLLRGGGFAVIASVFTLLAHIWPLLCK